MHRRSLLLSAASLPFLLNAALAQAGGTVSVLYAGSLVNLMERGLGPAFDKTGGGHFQGFAGGSNGLANQIKGRLRHGDVFVSANPAVNADLMGAANGGWVAWYLTFAQSPLVIGYNPGSVVAADLRSQPWYQALQTPGIRIGRTDPKLDPKGKLTVQLLDKAAETLKQPDLPRKVLGAADNPAQVFPEEDLVGRLQSGQLDVGFFYSTETADLHIPAITFPADVTLSAHYTATVLHDAANPEGAAHFVAFILGEQGQSIMRQHGLDVLKPALSGATAQVPAAIRQAVSTAA